MAILENNPDVARYVLKDWQDFYALNRKYAVGLANLLLTQDKQKHLVYFSSLSIFYSDTRYTAHKKYMEYLIKNNFPHYAIVRLGNIAWGKNPHTLINYLRNHPDAPIQDVDRYICSEDEFLHWMRLIPEWNVEMNITGRRLRRSTRN